jgi:hypothetical protein
VLRETDLRSNSCRAGEDLYPRQADQLVEVRLLWSHRQGAWQLLRLRRTGTDEVRTAKFLAYGLLVLIFGCVAWFFWLYFTEWR